MPAKKKMIVKKEKKVIPAAKKETKLSVRPSFMIKVPAITLVATEVDGVMVFIPTFERKGRNALLKATRTLKSDLHGMDSLTQDTEAALADHKKPKKEKAEKEEVEETEEDAEEEEDDEDDEA